ALRKGSVVVPLVAERDADRRICLEHLNYRDVSDPGPYAAAVDRVVADLLAGPVARCRRGSPRRASPFRRISARARARSPRRGRSSPATAPNAAWAWTDGRARLDRPRTGALPRSGRSGGIPERYHLADDRSGQRRAAGAAPGGWLLSGRLARRVRDAHER